MSYHWCIVNVNASARLTACCALWYLNVAFGPSDNRIIRQHHCDGTRANGQSVAGELQDQNCCSISSWMKDVERAFIQFFQILNIPSNNITYLSKLTPHLCLCSAPWLGWTQASLH